MGKLRLETRAYPDLVQCQAAAIFLHFTAQGKQMGLGVFKGGCPGSRPRLVRSYPENLTVESSHGWLGQVPWGLLLASRRWVRRDFTGAPGLQWAKLQ